MAILVMIMGTSCTTIGGSDPIVRNAKSWQGKHYKHGSTHQCANWVTHVVKKAGKQPPTGSSKSSSWSNWGKTVPKSQIKPGDVLVFSGTYKRGISHVGIALGEGQFIHRSTHGAPVKVSSLDRYRIATVRRG